MKVLPWVASSDPSRVMEWTALLDSIIQWHIIYQGQQSKMREKKEQTMKDTVSRWALLLPLTVLQWVVLLDPMVFI